MIGSITQVLAETDLNIENMANKSRGDNAYTLLEVTGKLDDSIAEKIAALDNVYRVRVITR